MASNRQVADHTGISDQGQVSKLLSRLERFGLIGNAGKARARGEANAWKLTAAGARVAEVVCVGGPEAGEEFVSASFGLGAVCRGLCVFCSCVSRRGWLAC